MEGLLHGLALVISLGCIFYSFYHLIERGIRSEPFPSKTVKLTKLEIKKVLLAVVGLHLVSLVLVFLYQYFTVKTGPLQLLLNFNRWDADHYTSIAREGYPTQGKMQVRIVFLPLYPLCIALLSKLTFLKEEYAAILLNVLFSGLFGLSFYRLVRLDYSEKVAFWAVVLFAVFPPQIVQITPYTEPLYLFFAVEAFYWARTDHWGRSGVAAFFAALARTNGYFLFPALAIEFFRRRKWDMKGFWLAAAPFAFLIYLFINQRLYGDPFKFTYFQRVNWYKEFKPFWKGLSDVFHVYGITDWHSFLTGRLAEAAACFFGSVLLVAVARRARVSYGVYSLFSLLFFLSTSWILSTPRYVSSIFPFALILAPTLERIGILRWVILGIFFAWFTYFLHAFNIGMWVF